MEKRIDNRGEFYALITYLSKAFACTPLLLSWIHMIVKKVLSMIISQIEKEQ